MSKMKNVAKNEIVLHDPYSNALCGGCIEEVEGGGAPAKLRVAKVG